MFIVVNRLIQIIFLVWPIFIQTWKAPALRFVIGQRPRPLFHFRAKVMSSFSVHIHNMCNQNTAVCVDVYYTSSSPTPVPSNLGPRYLVGKFENI